MRTTHLIPLVALLATGRAAHAEDRAMVIDVGVGFGGDLASESYPDFATGRIRLSWENAPLELPATKGSTFAGAIVPELVGGAILDNERAQGFVGAGLRAELRIAQRDMGLLELTARGAVYVAVRGLVFGDQRVPMIELGIGEYFTRWHNRTRVGFEFDFMRSTEDSSFDSETTGMFFHIFVGGAP